MICPDRREPPEYRDANTISRGQSAASRPLVSSTAPVSSAIPCLLNLHIKDGQVIDVQGEPDDPGQAGRRMLARRGASAPGAAQLPPQQRALISLTTVRPGTSLILNCRKIAVAVTKKL